MRMCGIGGLFWNDPALEPEPGAMLIDMPITITHRDPDNAGSDHCPHLGPRNRNGLFPGPRRHVDPNQEAGLKQTIDLESATLRDLNVTLQAQAKATNQTAWEIVNPKGSHAISVGLDAPIEVTIKGSTGYYCAGMNNQATINIKGSAEPGVAENMMSGTVVIDGDASQYASATAHGGTLIIKSNASSPCRISMKGIDIIVHGNIGHMSTFMAQSGNLVVCGDAGDALGDSIYEARLFVRGSVKSLGADCIEKDMRPEHISILTDLLERGGCDAKAEEFKRFGSARQLYHFNIDNAY
jgi:glutamate synthase domain-containing protein 3